MYSYLVSDDEYKKLEHQPRTEGQNLYFPEQRQSSQSTEDLQNDRPAAQSSEEEGESISFMAGESQASFPGTGEQRQAPYPRASGQGFTYPHLSTIPRKGVGNGQGQPGKQVDMFDY